MKLSEISTSSFDSKVWEEKGYQLPKFDLQAVREKTFREPTWLHFGAGNIFKAFQETGLVAKYYTVAEHTRVPDVQIASQHTWEILPEEYRDIILECAQESALYQRNRWVRNDIFARATVIDSGCEIIHLEPEQKLQFQEMVQPLYKKYCSDYLDLIKTIQNDTVVKTSTGE